MKLRVSWLLAVLVICMESVQVRAQEGQPGYRPPGTPGASGPENKYVELSHSKDRVIKATAERYLSLVKFQEWGGASGKTQIAKYVSHDPDLKRVKLSVAKGTGKDRVLKEFDVEVEKLSKTSQARVKQIDVLQKRLDELSAAAAKSDGTGRPGGPEGPGAPTGERGAHPRNGQEPEGVDAGPGAPTAGPNATPPQAAGPEVDPSASEPDPLGFAELPPTAAGPVPGAEAGHGVGPPGPVPGAAPLQGAGIPGPEGAPAVTAGPEGPSPADPQRRPPGAPAGTPSESKNPKTIEDLKEAFKAAFDSGDKAALEKLIYWGNASAMGKKITHSMLLDDVGQFKILKIEIQNGQEGISRPEYWTLTPSHAFKLELSAGVVKKYPIWPVGQVEGSYYLGAWNPKETKPAP